MSKYMLGDDGYYIGVVLKPGHTGIIQRVVFRPGGDWATRIGEDGSRYDFPLWTLFPNPQDSKRSLGELTKEEFECLIAKLDNFPPQAREELRGCYEVSRLLYQK